MLMQSDLLTINLGAPVPHQALIVEYLWLIPGLPILASGVIALLKQPRRKLSAGLAIAALSVSLLLSLAAFWHVINTRALLLNFGFNPAVRETLKFT